MYRFMRAAFAAPVLVSLAWVCQASAQPTAEQFEIYERYLDFGSLVRGGRIVPGWMPDGSNFWYTDGDAQNTLINKVDPDAGTVEPLFDVPRLRTALEEALGEEPAGQGVPFRQLQFVSPQRVRFALQGETLELDLDSYSVEKQTKPAPALTEFVTDEAERTTPGMFLKERFTGGGRMFAPEAVSPDGKWFLSTRDHDVILRATVDGREVQVTADGTSEYFWDVESVFWQPWSPDAQKFVVFKQDVRAMRRVPTIHWLKPMEEADEAIVTPAGGAMARSELYVIDVHGLRSLHVDLGDTTDQYIVVLGWLSDGSQFLVGRYDRVFSRVEILAVDSRSGTVRSVLTERSETFLTSHHEALWEVQGSGPGLTLLPDDSGFIWESERDGWNHLYQYDLSGKLIRRLTRGDFPIRQVLRVDLRDGWVYFTAHGDPSRVYDTHLYRVGLDGRGFQQLTEGKGQHEIRQAPSARYFVDTFSAVDVPPRTELRKADGTLLQVLDEADISRLRRLGWVPPREVVVKAADGETDLWVTMYLPSDFDPEKQYPLVEFIYGGPFFAVRPMTFDLSGNYNRALANLGFIVVSLDARGTAGRSKAFHDVVYGNWGGHEIVDHATAIRHLAERFEFIDPGRVGIWGSSWGGHFAFRALTQAPDLYKVGISQSPGLSPYRHTLYEPYIGLPQDNKAAYEKADPFNLAGRLEGELLLIAGANDTATVSDLFKMSETLIRLGKLHRVMIYPNSGHGPTGRTAEYDRDLKTQFFIDKLLDCATAEDVECE